MLANQLFSQLKHIRGAVCSRNLGIMAPLMQKTATDPIQQLFLEKLKEYMSKSEGGKRLVDPTPEVERDLKQELEKIAKAYGGGEGVDMTKFPTFKFTDPQIDPLNVETK